MKKKKLVVRIVMLVIATAMVVGIVFSAVMPMIVSAEEAEDLTVKTFETGALEKAISDTLVNRTKENIKEVTVLNGTLNAKDFEALASFENCTVIDLKGCSSDIVSLPDYIFSVKDSKLMSISLPSNISIIGKNSFAECRSLQTVFCQSGLKQIGEKAFKNCKSLETIYIPETVERIDEEAFYGCSELKKISGKDDFVFPSTLKFLGKYSFGECVSIKNAVFPEDMKEIGQGAFSDCFSLKNAEFIGMTAPLLGPDAFPTDIEILFPENAVGYDKWSIYKIKENKPEITEVETASMYVPQEEPDIIDNVLTGSVTESEKVTETEQKNDISVSGSDLKTEIETMSESGISETSENAIPVSGTETGITVQKIIIVLVSCFIGVLLISQLLLKCFKKIDDR